MSIDSWKYLLLVFICSGGLVLGCEGKINDPCGPCEGPPPSACLDSSTLRVFDLQGQCVGGQCEYPFEDIHCPQGCQDAMCLGCEPSTCEAEGVECGEIPDECGGFLSCGPCGDPPSSACQDSDTLRTFDLQGQCIGGQCEYPFEDIHCSHGCQDAVCLECEPTTCEAEGVECGEIPDGCGGFLSCGECDQDTIAWWRFDEGAGDTAADSSGNENHGEIRGGQWSPDGKSGYALEFDGIDDYVKIPDSERLDPTGELTIEAWVNGIGPGFRTTERSLPGGVPGGKPKLTVVGEKIYYAFNAGDPADLWFAVGDLAGSGWQAFRLTSGSRVDWQLEHQVVGDEIFFVWRTNDCELYGARVNTDGGNYRETNLTFSSGEDRHA